LTLLILVLFGTFCYLATSSALLEMGVCMGATMVVIAACRRGAFAAARWVAAQTTWFPRSVTSQATKNASKFSEQAWQLAVHAGMAVFETCILWREGAFSHDDLCQRTFDERRTETSCDTFYLPLAGAETRLGKVASDYLEPPGYLRMFFSAQLGIWFYTAFSHRFVEERRKDYFVMYAHHVMTVALVILAMYKGCLRYGLVVLFLHDVSDVPIDLLKMSNYLGLDSKSGLYLTELSFVATLAGWVYFRFFHFFWVYWPPFNGASDALWGPTDAHIVNREGPIMLMFLQCLHVYWFLLFLRILRKLIRGDATQDVGDEEYEGTSRVLHKKRAD
jgi:ceramide synthetase